MTTAAYRVTRREYAQNIAQLLDGEGGRRVSGRWHLRGTPVVYLASSRALGMLETIVHLEIHPKEDVSKRIAVQLQIPEDLMGPGQVRRLTAAELETLDPAWRLVRNTTCLRIGRQWFLDGQHWGLQVPSAVVPDDWNLVVNCTHPSVRDLIARCGFSVSDASFDPRIVEIISEEALRIRRSRSVP